MLTIASSPQDFERLVATAFAALTRVRTLRPEVIRQLPFRSVHGGDFLAIRAMRVRVFHSAAGRTPPNWRAQLRMCGEASAPELGGFAQKRQRAIAANRSHASRLTCVLHGAAARRGPAVAF